ncbi:RASF2 protein, partial [Chordeiles acutipennis]|nr:RASF2 protein [Chordeiles acutipennis]
MDYGGGEYLVPCGKDKYISKNELLLHLKTYNIYYEGQNLQLRHREVRKLREKTNKQTTNKKICVGARRGNDPGYRSLCGRALTGHPSALFLITRSVLKPSTLPDIQVTDVDAAGNGAGEPGSEPVGFGSSSAKSQPEETPQLMRTRSDVGVRRRGNVRTPSEQRRIRRHRFSINGHFYNHKTSVFTPAYGSVTNVRINSTMTTPQVLKLLLNKFKIENSAEEFALYIVHTSGEKQKLRASDYPLIARILQGPCEQVSKVFLMEKDQVEEITYDVAQYIKFEMPVLKSFIQKLEEEEDREVKKLMRKYSILRLMIEQRLEEISEGPTAM